MKQIHLAVVTFLLCLAYSCDNGLTPPNQHTQEPDTTTIVPKSRYALGVDVSLLPRFIEAGGVYKDEAGATVSDPLAFFKEKGFNYVRCRIFVDPDLSSTACQDLAYVKAFASQIKAAGLKFMLDFHYSDTWADPAKQYTPKAWENQDLEELKQTLHNYTLETLNDLKASGIIPDIIQVGNEITPGMLWETGHVSLWGDQYDNETQWNAFLSLLKEAINACRTAAPDAKLVLHTERGCYEPGTFRFYNIMKQNNVDYDIIGLSYYPFWHGTFDELKTTLTSLKNNFSDKEVMIVETAYPYNDWGYPSDASISKPYPSTPEGQKAFTEAFINLLKGYDNITGLFWWFAEDTYTPETSVHPYFWRGLFSNEDGKALPAINSFASFLE